MVETYGAHETRVYYVEESSYGVTPDSPSMLGLPAESVESSVNPSLVRVRGVGSRDLQMIKRGLRDCRLKVVYPLPSAAPINFLQHHAHNVGLSVEVLYYKGAWASATDIISLRHVGCRFDKVTVECSVEDVVKATAELVGFSTVIEASKIPGATYSEYSGAVSFNESYVKKAGTTIYRVTDWKWSIENNLRQVPVIRSADGHLLKYLPYRHRSLSGELTFEFEDIEEYLELLNDSEFSLEFGLGGSNKAVFSNCKWDKVSMPTRVEDLVFCKAGFVAKSVAIS